MKFSLLVLIAGLLSVTAHASDDTVLIQKLKEAKFSLIDVIAFSEKNSGPAISAKFEMDGNDLVFSVYTAPQGLKASAEETALSELAGPATSLPIDAKTEIFTDKEHIARASTHLTLMELSKLNLTQVIRMALHAQPGFAFSVKNPTVKNRKAIAEVMILKDDGQVVTVSVDLIANHLSK